MGLFRNKFFFGCLQLYSKIFLIPQALSCTAGVDRSSIQSVANFSTSLGSMVAAFQYFPLLPSGTQAYAEHLNDYHAYWGPNATHDLVCGSVCRNLEVLESAVAPASDNATVWTSCSRGSLSLCTHNNQTAKFCLVYYILQCTHTPGIGRRVLFQSLLQYGDLDTGSSAVHKSERHTHRIMTSVNILPRPTFCTVEHV